MKQSTVKHVKRKTGQPRPGAGTGGRRALLRFFCSFFPAFCLILVCAGCGLFRNSAPPGGVSSRTPKPVYEMPPRTKPKLYLDVSSWNEEIDWAAVKEAGVSGVILRIARYNLEIDSRFDEYYSGAKENGLSVGCYFFMNARTEEQA